MSRAKDLQVLRALVQCEELEEEENAAFSDMYDRISSGRIQTLSNKQRDWAERVYYKHSLDKDEPSENLVSRGKIKVTAEERASLQEFLKSLGPRPLKPPGRV